ncbi:VOC family protein [Paenarthrobacter sp. NPDC057981]|uniref:VOC family protein n=1 Tax=Paenarthrobacter sp. NPDC057981 TaxID=3346297 RepID=UPI0036D78F68
MPPALGGVHLQLHWKEHELRTYRPNHTAVSVRDMNASLDFYGALGFKVVNRTTFDGEELVHIQLGEYLLELFAFRKNAGQPPLQLGYGNGPESLGVKHLAFATDDIHAALVDLKERGLADDSISVEGEAEGKVQWFFITDPDGMWVEIIQEDRFPVYAAPWPGM